MKILIIEDEYNLADAISSMLKKEKYTVVIETDGEKGLDEALTDLYDLIILDVMLPHKNGFDILKELRKEKINSKVLMLTAKNTIDDKMIGFNNGADDYLTKPFHMEELMARVNVQLRKNINMSNDIIELGDIILNIRSMELSNINNEHKVKIIGKELKALGINTNFAPVVDVNTNPANSIDGIRSFSDDPNIVATYSEKFMEGLQSEGIITSLKHFPGHGDTTTDSHDKFVVIEKSYDDLLNTELIPFKKLISISNK